MGLCLHVRLARASAPGHIELMSLLAPFMTSCQLKFASVAGAILRLCRRHILRRAAGGVMLAAGGLSMWAASAAGATSDARDSSGGRGAEAFLYVALGDSTGAGYGAREAGGYVDRIYTRLLAERPQARLQNLCVNGATSADVLRRQVPAATSARRPSLITLQVGVNDLSRQVTAVEFGRGYESIVKALVATGAPVIVSNLPDVSLAPVVPTYLRPEIGRRIKAFNEQITSIARQQGATLVDIYGPSQELIPRRPDLFSSDGFHPSDAGYQFWADQIWPAVQRILR